MNDDDLNEYLEGGSDLSSLYAESKTAPVGTSESIDQSILAAAKRSVGSQPTSAKASPIRRWGVPASVAATVLLSTTLYLTNQQEIEYSSQPESYAPTESAINEARKNTADKREAITETESLSADRIAPLEKKKAYANSPAPAAIPGSVVGKSTMSSKENTAQLRYQAAPTAPSRSDMTETPKRQIQHGLIAPAVTPMKTQEVDETENLNQASGRLEVPVEEQLSADFRTSPKTWISYIESLLASGDIPFAQDELEAFIVRHPDFQLPANLAQLTDIPRP
ncbi:MAG: hypothetical protein V7677_16505 [Motiliproteus sp.]